MKMAENKTKYDEITRAKISESRNLVISSCSKGGYTLAQQLGIADGKATVSVFLKGAIHISDRDALERVRDAINVALKQIDNGSVGAEGVAWDEPMGK